MIDQQTYTRYAEDPSAFRRDLLIDVNGSIRRLGDVMDPWQNADFAALDPALQLCVGRSTADTTTRFYLERSRGHSKTTDLAITAVWALAFATRPIRGYCFAADKDQAGLLKDAMSTIIRLNPWLSNILDVQRTSVINIASGHPGSRAKLDIFTSDVASSYGILPDFIIADELCHWAGDGSLWHSLLSSAAKRSNCLLVTISNAGFAESWQWNIREAARTDPSWHFSRLEGPVASWLTQERLDEQRRMLPPVAYARLWLNQWSASGGDALSPRDINACFDPTLQPMTGNEQGWLFITGCDLGLVRDFAAAVTLAVPDPAIQQGYARIRLADAHLWRPPTDGGKVDLTEIEYYILQLDKRFGLEQVVLDPWQAELLGQRLETDTTHRRRNQRRRLWTKPWVNMLPPSSVTLRDQASLTIESFADHRFRFYDYDPLRRDLLKLRAEEKQYGIRLTSPRDGEGHGDTFSAFALALLVGHEYTHAKSNPIGIVSQDGNLVGSGPNSTERTVQEKFRQIESLNAYQERLFAQPDLDIDAIGQPGSNTQIHTLDL